MPLSDLPVQIARLAAWLILLTLLFLPLERLLAPAGGARPWRERTADVALYFVNGIVPAAILAIPLAAVVAAAHRVLPGVYLAWAAGLPLWLKLALGFLVAEVGFYWGHRWTHELPWLWQFHAVHHRPERLDWLVNARAHPVDMVFVRLCGLAPVYALGFAGGGRAADNMVAALLVVATTIWGFLLHADIRVRLGWLERIVATPAFHHWHHTRSGPIDRNYAASLPLLDRVFGTHHLPRAGWPVDYGIRAEPAPARQDAGDTTAQATRSPAPPIGCVR